MRLLLGFALGLALLGASGTAQADPITSAQTSYGGPGTDYTLSYNFNGNSANTSIGRTFTTKGWDGDTSLPPTITEATWCVDLMHFIASTPKHVTVQVVSGAFNDGVHALARNIGAAAWLDKMFDATATNSIKRAALQVAIWEAIYDNDGDLNSGKFKVNSVNSDIKTQAKAYLQASLSAGGGTFSQATGKVYSFKGKSQDQMNFLIPEPTSFAMAALAGLAGLGIRLRNRRRAKTA